MGYLISLIIWPSSYPVFVSQASLEPRPRLHRGAGPGRVGRSAVAAVASAILQRRPRLGGRRGAGREGDKRRNGMADATGGAELEMVIYIEALNVGSC